MLNLRFALVTYFCVRSLRANPRSPCLACFSEPVLDGYASHYCVALRQPSVIYAKVNSVRFSSRSLYCSHLQGVMGRGSVPHAPRSARISEPVLGVLFVYCSHIQGLMGKKRAVCVCLVLLASLNPCWTFSILSFRPRAQPAWRNLNRNVTARQLITVLRGRANRCKTAQGIV